MYTTLDDPLNVIYILNITIKSYVLNKNRKIVTVGSRVRCTVLGGLIFNISALMPVIDEDYISEININA